MTTTTLEDIADQPLEPCCSGCGVPVGPDIGIWLTPGGAGVWQCDACFGWDPSATCHPAPNTPYRTLH